MFKSKLPGRVSVSEPTKTQDTLYPYVKYKVRMSNFPTMMVKRRYNDFVWLAEILKLENGDCVIPGTLGNPLGNHS